MKTTSHLRYIAIFLLTLPGILLGENGKDQILVKIGDPAAATHKLLSSHFEKIASGGFFETTKNNREVISKSSGFCKQYRIRKGEQTLTFITSQKDDIIVGLAATADDTPLEFDAIPWVEAAEAKIDLNQMKVIWSTPHKAEKKLPKSEETQSAPN